MATTEYLREGSVVSPYQGAQAAAMDDGCFVNRMGAEGIIWAAVDAEQI